MNEEGGRRGGGGAEMDPWGGGCCCCGGCRWGLREDSGLHVSTKHITNGPGSSGRTEGHGGNDVWQHGGAETTDPGGTVRGDYRLCLGAGEAAPAGGSLAVRDRPERILSGDGILQRAFSAPDALHAGEHARDPAELPRRSRHVLEAVHVRRRGLVRSQPRGTRPHVSTWLLRIFLAPITPRGVHALGQSDLHLATDIPTTFDASDSSCGFGSRWKAMNFILQFPPPPPTFFVSTRFTPPHLEDLAEN